MSNVGQRDKSAKILYIISLRGHTKEPIFIPLAANVGIIAQIVKKLLFKLSV
jgi:hypothetical protein